MDLSKVLLLTRFVGNVSLQCTLGTSLEKRKESQLMLVFKERHHELLCNLLFMLYK